MSDSADRPVITSDPGLFALAERMASRGFTERRVLAYFGWSHPAAAATVPARPRGQVTPASVLPILLCTSEPVPLELGRDALGHDFEAARRSGLVIAENQALRSQVAVWPLAGSVMVCDHPGNRDDAVSAPDDSSYHLLGVLPRHVQRWLDVGTGNGFLPIGRGGRAEVIGTDVHRRAIELARLGAHLSGRRGVQFAVADGAEIEPLADQEGSRASTAGFDLITFNRPLAVDAGQRHGYRIESDPGLMARFWPRARELLGPDGEILVHTRIEPELPKALRRGAVTVVTYTEEHAETTFGIIRWQPDRGDRIDRRRRPLSAARPHLVRDDLASS